MSITVQTAAGDYGSPGSFLAVAFTFRNLSTTEWVVDGAFTATADDGSSLTLEAHADGTVTIAVDEDGDGSAHATIETTGGEIGL